MKANELRIGNYYIDEDGYEHQVIAKDFSWMGWDYCRPIPLTENWLLKFGFEEGLAYWILPNNNFFFGVDIEIGLLFMFEDTQSLKHIKHVHQLQNLYHALTGEELIYNIE